MKIRSLWTVAGAMMMVCLGSAVRGEAPVVTNSNDISFDYYETSSTSAADLASFGGEADDCKGSCSKSACSCKSGQLGGLIAPSDQGFSDFITPMTNPVFFEDPRIATEAKVLFIHQKIPGAAGGGSAQLYAMQVQAALNDRLSIVADKDGYVVSQNPLIDDGWADIAMGLKYNLLANYEAQRLLSAGLSYELPVGSTRTRQGNGDGEFHLYLTGGAQLGCDWHWISGTGFRLPTDASDESQVWYWSNHLDRKITDCVYAFGEVNWYHWMRSGNQTALAGVEGGDLFNFGSTGVAGNDIVTGAFGLKYKPSNGLEVGIAWEAPMTNRRDVLDNRLTVDTILRY